MEFVPGSLCSRCQAGTLRVQNSHVKQFGEHRVRVRYYRCWNCGWAPDNNKLIVPIEFAPPRVRIRRPSTKLGTGHRRRSGFLR